MIGRTCLAMLALACWVPGSGRCLAADPGTVDEPAATAVVAPTDAGAETAAAPDVDAAAPEPSGESPRQRYNRALEQLQAGSPAAAADGFLAARDTAGPDPELRYRAAFNLGIALAGEADASGGAPADAIDRLRDSAAWFHDAVRLAPEGDEDARVNLEVVLRRIQQLADQLNEGNRLEARLDRIIDDQRGIRDGLRRLLGEVEAEGAAAEPTGYQDAFDSLAVRERALLAEASDIADLAAEERAHIEAQGQEQMTPERRTRALQLQGLDEYLQRARQSLSDTRRRLRRLEGERAHRRGDTALAELKRAREQLLDPVSVLKAIARDQLSVLAHTQALAALDNAEIAVQAGLEGEAPPWLTARHLGNRQEDAAARTGGILRQMEAVVDLPAGDSGDPQAARTVAAAGEAVPLLEGALESMRTVLTTLDNGALVGAVRAQSDALRALNRAIERFAGLRDLIELAYADQGRVVGLLTPPEDEEGVAELSAEERAGMVGAAVGDNRERLSRLEPLLAESLGEATNEDGGTETDAAAAAAARERYELAEALRAAALEALKAVTEQLDVAGAPGATPLAPAREAFGHLEALRRLFFSIVEHLQALLAEQTDTHDRTATLQFESQVDEMAATLGLVGERQGGHAAVADALGEALAQQADATPEPAGLSGTPPAAGGESAAVGTQAAGVAEAAREVRAAAGRMHGAQAVIADALQRAASMSPDLEPALGDQSAAMEHVENAIRLLQPPQEGESGGESQPASAGEQGMERQPEDSERMSQRQALRRLQAIRDRDAQRQRERRQGGRPEPVEKDW